MSDIHDRLKKGKSQKSIEIKVVERKSMGVLEQAIQNQLVDHKDVKVAKNRLDKNLVLDRQTICVRISDGTRRPRDMRTGGHARYKPCGTPPKPSRTANNN